MVRPARGAFWRCLRSPKPVKQVVLPRVMNVAKSMRLEMKRNKKCAIEDLGSYVLPNGCPMSPGARSPSCSRSTSIGIWALLGPLFGYSDTWQLVINTATTIITFLMVFVIQNTQNRDTASMHIKIDELIRVTEKARNVLLDLEHLDDGELERLRQDYERLAREEIPLHLERRRSRAQSRSDKPTRG